MNRLEKALLREAIGDEEPRFSLRTRTRIDAGRWWRRTPVWLCTTNEELLTLAVGRRRHLERIPLDGCGESRYCASAGELVIAPTEALEINRLAMTPAEGVRALESILLDTD